MSEALVTFRETLEAALVVGLLARFTPQQNRWLLWLGIGSAVLVSLVGGWGLHLIASSHVWWEILLSYAAAGMLLYMVGWMRRRSAALAQTLQQTTQTREGFMLFSMSFLAVAREGLETAIFLRALWHMQHGVSWLSGIIGIALAVAIGLALFYFSAKLPLRPLFHVSSVLLLLIASGIATYGTHETLEYLGERYAFFHELEEAKAWHLFSPATTPPPQLAAWYAFDGEKYYHPLHHKGYLGSLLQVLTGWRASLSWAELATWLLTFSLGWWWWRKKS